MNQHVKLPTWKKLTPAGRVAILDTVADGSYKSASQLADDVSKHLSPPYPTRNAIIGMLNRHKSKAELNPNRPSGRTRSLCFTSDTMQTTGRPMALLEANQCKFAVNDAYGFQKHLFCCAPTHGEPYCQHHTMTVRQG